MGLQPSARGNPYRILVIEVIRAALDDIERGPRSQHKGSRSSAKDWIAERTDYPPQCLSLRRACDAAGVSPERVRNEAKRRLEAN